MGSLALAAYGAAGGLGQGITQVAQQEQKKQLIEHESDLATQREQTIARLKDKFEKENMANQQQFQSGEKTRELQAHGAIAKAEMEQKGELAHEHEAGATERAHISANARVEARRVGAPGPKPEKPEFTHKTLTEQSSVVNGTIVPGRSYDLLLHKSGQGFVSAGDMYLPYDASSTEFPDPAKVARAPADKLNLLEQHPEKLMDFAQKYGYIPRNALMAYQQQKEAGSPGLPGFVKPGTKAGPETPIGGNKASAQDTEDDVEEGEGDDPYGRNGAPTSQPNDSEPTE